MIGTERRHQYALSLFVTLNPSLTTYYNMMPCRMVTTDVSEGIAASMFEFVQSKKPLTGLAVLPVSSEQYRQFTVHPEIVCF